MQALSNLVETDHGNVTFMRILAFKMDMLGEYDYAVDLYERVLETR
jgi:cytochrome c-type biogenesis protein CcmH/NrfG